MLISMAAQGVNSAGSGPYLAATFKVLLSSKAVNLADDNIGGIFTGVAPGQILANANEKSYMGAVFTSEADLEQVLADLGKHGLHGGHHLSSGGRRLHPGYSCARGARVRPRARRQGQRGPRPPAGRLRSKETALKDLRALIEKHGVPGRDPHDLPSSSLRFPDGAHCRIEIAGVERLSALEAMLDESERRSTPIHRVIATVGGSTLITMDELREYARLAHHAGLEVIVTLGASRGWDTGRQIATREGLVSGMRVRGSDNLSYVVGDVMRCLEAGFRGFLVVDEGLLWLLAEMRAKGDLPRDCIFKVSVFAGHANAAGAKVLESLGANTFNPLADLTLPMLAGIRGAVKIPMDVYLSIVDAMGGFNRFWEAAEIARVCAPCYFKFEPGAAEDAVYKPWVTPEFHQFFTREKVRLASIALELIGRCNPEIRVSGRAPSDLAVPVLV